MSMHDIWEECVVNEQDIRDEVDRLVTFMQPYFPLFGRAESQGHGLTYVMGRMERLSRRTIEPIANEHGIERRPLQRFVGAGLWDDKPVIDQLVGQVAGELGTSDGVLVVDASGFKKCGTNSVGVQRQWCGREGKIENCQVGEFLAYASRKGSALVDRRLYLPASWADDPVRRAKAYVPPEVEFRTGWQLALEMIKKHAETLPHRWILGDDQYGRATKFRDSLNGINERYLLEVPSNTVVGIGRGAGKPKRVDQVAEQLRKREWSLIKTRDGEKGPIEVKAAKMRVSTSRDKKKYRRETLLIIERSDGVRQYYLSNARGVSVSKMAKAAACRNYVEVSIKDAKGEAGLAEYEVRSWVGWHHHMTLSLLATFFLVCEKNRLKKNGGDDCSSSALGDGMFARTEWCDLGKY